MARTGVSYEEVEQIASQLYQQGINPTVQRIRHALGTGSNTTISRHLKTWHDTFFEENQARVAMPIPEDIVASVDNFWAAAVAKADTNYQKYRDEVDCERDSAVKAKEHALLQLDSAQKEKEQLKAELDKSTRDNQELQNTLQRLQGQYDELGKKYELTLKEGKEIKTLAHAAIEQAENAKQNYSEQLADRKQHYECVIEKLNQTLAAEKARYDELQSLNLNQIGELKQITNQANDHVIKLEKTLSDTQNRSETSLQSLHQQVNLMASQFDETKHQLQKTSQDYASLQQKVDNTFSNYELNMSLNQKLVDAVTESERTQDIILTHISKLHSEVSSVIMRLAKSGKNGQN